LEESKILRTLDVEKANQLFNRINKEENSGGNELIDYIIFTNIIGF